jgi:hypothetical protein
VKKKEMKTTTRLIGVVAIAMTLTIAFSGVALACCAVPETVCTSIIETTTVVTCQGTVTEEESLTFEQANVDLNAIPPLPGAAVYANTRYSESMIATNGYTVFGKSFELDTSDSGGVPDHNLEVSKTFDYVANAGGGLIFSETVAVDAISSFQAGPALMCPFAAAPAGVIPESCESVTAGSTLDVTEVSATTNTETITTAMSADTTPLILHYDVHAGDTLLTPNIVGAVGSGSAFVTVHDMEGLIPGAVPPLGVEITFDEETTASGVFDLYKTIDYTSGILLP